MFWQIRCYTAQLWKFNRCYLIFLLAGIQINAVNWVRSNSGQVCVAHCLRLESDDSLLRSSEKCRKLGSGRFRATQLGNLNRCYLVVLLAGILKNDGSWIRSDLGPSNFAHCLRMNSNYLVADSQAHNSLFPRRRFRLQPEGFAQCLRLGANDSALRSSD